MHALIIVLFFVSSLLFVYTCLSQYRKFSVQYVIFSTCVSGLCSMWMILDELWLWLCQINWHAYVYSRLYLNCNMWESIQTFQLHAGGVMVNALHSSLRSWSEGCELEIYSRPISKYGQFYFDCDNYTLKEYIATVQPTIVTLIIQLHAWHCTVYSMD